LKAAGPNAGQQAKLARVLRPILLNLFLRLACADPMTADAMQRLIERLHAGKVKRALARFQEAQECPGQRSPDFRGAAKIGPPHPSKRLTPHTRLTLTSSSSQVCIIGWVGR
jgi:hypothetical protein